MAQSIRRKRNKPNNLLGYVILALTFFVIVIFGALWFYAKGQYVEIDKDSLCPKSCPAEVTVVLIDQTDPFTTVQRESLRQHLKDITQEIPRHGLLELYTIAPIREDLLKPKFRMCNPGRGSEINPIIGNPALVERRWREDFFVHLEKSLEDIWRPDQATNSPIMESIQSVAVSAFKDPSVSQIPKRLIIISDMIQHTSELSQYGGLIDFDTFRSSAYYIRVRPSLNDVKVEIYYLRRTTRRQIQGRKHIEFWQSFIADAGGTLIRVISVEG